MWKVKLKLVFVWREVIAVRAVGKVGRRWPMHLAMVDIVRGNDPKRHGGRWRSTNPQRGRRRGHLSTVLARRERGGWCQVGRINADRYGDRDGGEGEYVFLG
jgi:hypothetical protein